MTLPLTNALSGAAVGNSADVYTDFAGLAALKREAKANDPEAIRAVAKQYEGLFARMMIKSMRDAVGKDPIFGSDQAQTYQGMYDDQLSLELTRGKGLGLADMLVRQLRQSGATANAAAGGAAAEAGRASGMARAPAAGSASSAERAGFISQVWPQAQQAAQQLGVHPVSLIAQAALETNWGRSVPRSASGASSNNLFGIKAGASWNGDSVIAGTQEFQGGAAHGTSAVFRVYASPGESFQDYAALLQRNPRFSGALGSGTNVASFAAALQQGGYATDADYARKVTAVAGQVLATLGQGTHAASQALKLAGAVPMTSATRQAPGEELGHG
jgi:peptidoglycan hydrolase FlgJ